MLPGHNRAMRAVLEESGLFRFTGLPPGFAAGFTTRRLAPDEAGAAEATRRLAIALGAPEAERARPRQVHGRAVIVLEERPRAGADVVAGEADALLTREPGRLLAVASADCVPILLLDAETGWMAAVHAGWRGTAARILDAVLDALEARGALASRLVALFGPSISRDRYEVGPEVVDLMRRSYEQIEVPTKAIRAGAGDRSFLDVAAFDSALLLARGVPVTSIRATGLCSAERADFFPSYRRDGARTGRIMTGTVSMR
jgi:YfiH family protein